MSTPAGLTTLPPTKALRDTLLDLLGRDVQVAPSSPWSPTLKEPGAVAVYVDNGMKLRALICCDLPLAVALGASIALIPAKRASECIKGGTLTGELSENLYEVLNVLCGLFNLPDHPHVKLYEVHSPGKLAPEDLGVRLRAFGKREDLKVDVAGYGSGLLSFVVV
jgi:hypothetical protein